MRVSAHEGNFWEGTQGPKCPFPSQVKACRGLLGKEGAACGSRVKTCQPWPHKPLVQLTHWAVTWLPGTCISHFSGPQRTQDQSYRPAF